ncbi:IS1 family transposase [Candidatus Woesearchaeota archaeon]|nr:IS1 family transposase [Candidatus Woesearchaeota archaeon]
MEMKIKCRHCKSESVVKRGLSPTQNRGMQQRYLCNDCHKTFIPDFGFWKNNKKTVGLQKSSK